LPVRDDGGWQPVHVDGEVVGSAQVGVGGDGSLAQHFEKMLGLGVDQQARADQVEGFVLGRGLPAVLRGAGLEFDDLVEHVLPGALADQGIAVLEIDASQAEVHRGLLAGFVEGQQQAHGLGAVFGLEALEGFGGVVEGVVNALATEEEAVTFFHRSMFIEPIAEPISTVSTSRHNHAAIVRAS
jgi:hypothetical protein